MHYTSLDVYYMLRFRENDMKENKMGNTWQALIKSILNILLKSHSKLPSHLFKKEDLADGGGGKMK